MPKRRPSDADLAGLARDSASALASLRRMAEQARRIPGARRQARQLAGLVSALEHRVLPGLAENVADLRGEPEAGPYLGEMLDPAGRRTVADLAREGPGVRHLLFGLRVRPVEGGPWARIRGTKWDRSVPGGPPPLLVMVGRGGWEPASGWRPAEPLPRRPRRMPLPAGAPGATDPSEPATLADLIAAFDRSDWFDGEAG